MDGSEEEGRISRLCAALARITASLEPGTVLTEVVEGARALTGALRAGTTRETGRDGEAVLRAVRSARRFVVGMSLVPGRSAACGTPVYSRISLYRLFLLRAALSPDVEVHLRAEAHFSRSSSR